MSATEAASTMAPKRKAGRPAKEKAPKVIVTKEKKVKAAPKEKVIHPPYFQMIKEAIVALKEKHGSSPRAIAKYVEEKHKAVLPANYRKMLGLQLKNSATKGKLTKVKASYKLADSEKLATKKAEPKKVGRPAKKSVSVAAPKAKAPLEKKVTGGKKAAEAKPKATLEKKVTVGKKTIKAPIEKKVTGGKRKVMSKASGTPKKVGRPVKKAGTPKKAKAVVKPKQLKSIKSPAKKAKKSAA